MSIQPWLAAAVQHHQAGQLHEAEKLYRQILAIEPLHADALHLLGVIAHQVGRHDLAVEHIEAALRVRGHDGEMFANLGAAYVAQGRTADAESCYRQAIQLQPGSSAAHYNLGTVLLQQNRFAEAVAAYRQALQLQPDNVSALNNLGHALKAQGDPDGAAGAFEQALHFQPGWAEAHINLGTVREAQGRATEAVACYRQALHLRPDLAEGHYNLGRTLRALGYPSEAAASLDRAVQLGPGNPDAHFLLGMVLLLQGKWARGWPEYEWRWRTTHFTVPHYAQGRAWEGADLQGRTIILYAEQGLGDTLQFARYAPLVQERGGRVLLRCQDCLASLVKGIRGINGVVPRSQPVPPFDCAAALLSLPRLFGTTPANIPAAIPYLHADPERRARWHGWLGRHPGRKIGVCWQGNPQHPEDAGRSVSLAALAPLAEVNGVRLVSLQISDGVDQSAQHGPSLGLLVPPVAAHDQGESFQELAALACELDLVVSVDTAAVHLAGALGVPTWAALPFVADWRWLRDRDDTPWYPTVRLFRQERPGGWDAVFERMAERLSRFQVAMGGSHHEQ